MDEIHFYFLFIFLDTLHGLWDLSSPTRDRTRAWQWKCQVLTSAPPGNSRNSFLYLEDYLKWCVHHIACAPDSISKVYRDKLKKLLMAIGNWPGSLGYPRPWLLSSNHWEIGLKASQMPYHCRLIVVSFSFATAYKGTHVSAIWKKQTDPTFHLTTSSCYSCSEELCNNYYFSTSLYVWIKKKLQEILRTQSNLWLISVPSLNLATKHVFIFLPLKWREVHS